MSTSTPRRRVANLLALCALTAAVAAGEPAPVADNVQKSDCRIWAKRFDPFELEWRLEVKPPAAAGAGSIRCVTRVVDGARGRKGAKVSLSAEVIGPAGKVVSLGSRTAKTDRSGVGVIEFPLAGVAAGQGLTARVTGRYASWKKVTTVTTDCGPAAP